MDFGAELLQPLLVRNAEVLLFVHDQQTEVLELDALAEQRMGADDDVDLAVREVLLDRQPSKQFATVEQIGGTVVYLCSPYADQVTGTTISVDGGWTAL